MRTYGISKRLYYHIDHMTPYVHPKFHNVIGKFKGGLVYHWNGPASINPVDDWIYIPDKGMRRIILEEVIQFKLLTSKRYSNMSIHVLATSLEKHVWATIGEVIQPFLLKTVLSKPRVMGTDSPNIHEDKLPPPNIEPSQAWN